MSTGLIDPRPPIKLRRQTLPTEVCEACGRKFYHHPDNANRFCSRECYHKTLGHDPELIALARRYWDMGLSGRAIAETVTDKFGRATTKNAIISIAHRNGFSPRPSPIKRAALGSVA
jgi:hypothetical protein